MFDNESMFPLFFEIIVKLTFQFNAIRFRSSHPNVFCEKGSKKISRNSHENILRKLQASKLPIKKEIPAQVFSYEFCEIFNPHPMSVYYGSPGTQALYFWRQVLLEKCQIAGFPCFPPFS